MLAVAGGTDVAASAVAEEGEKELDKGESPMTIMAREETKH